MGQRGRLDQGLVIDKLVSLARLNTPSSTRQRPKPPVSMISTDRNRIYHCKPGFRHGDTDRTGRRGSFVALHAGVSVTIVLVVFRNAVHMLCATKSCPFQRQPELRHDSPPHSIMEKWAAPFSPPAFRCLVGPNGIATGEDIGSGISMFRRVWMNR